MARLLKIDRKSLYRRMHKYGMATSHPSCHLARCASHRSRPARWLPVNVRGVPLQLAHPPAASAQPSRRRRESLPRYVVWSSITAAGALAFTDAIPVSLPVVDAYISLVPMTSLFAARSTK